LDCFRVAISEAISLAKDTNIDLRILDIGGGFTLKNFAQAAYHLRQEIAPAQEMFPNLQVIAEPGRFLACPAFTLTCQVIGKRGESECKPLVSTLTMAYLETSSMRSLRSKSSSLAMLYGERW
jgi:diaminopimelate decarboxylase